MTERQRIEDVYFPILCDRHNSKQTTVKKNKMSKEYVLKIADEFVISVLKIIFKYVIKFSGGYFEMGDGYCSREKHKRVYWNDGKKHWNELDNTTQYDACKRRIEEHEKLLKYTETYKENCGVIESLYNYLTEKHVELYIVIAPFPKQYLDSMSYDYCKKAVETCELLKRNSSYFHDCNNLILINGKREYHSEYDEEDYVDTDHLSDKGAIIFTEELKNLIYRNKNL